MTQKIINLDRSGLENVLQNICMAQHFYMLATFLTTSDHMCWLFPNSLNLSYFSHLTSYRLFPCYFYSSATFLKKYSTNEMYICSFIYSHTKHWASILYRHCVRKVLVIDTYITKEPFCLVIIHSYHRCPKNNNLNKTLKKIFAIWNFSGPVIWFLLVWGHLVIYYMWLI